MLLPPQELMALGGIIRDWKNDACVLLDAIAENLDIHQTVTRISEISPDIIVTICGFECFEQDMDALGEIKKKSPQSKIILFGHYATHFSKEILEKYDFDYIIAGEPDLIFSDLYDAVCGKSPIESVSGIAYKSSNGVVIQPGDLRINHPESLPMPAYELLNAQSYFEPFLPKPLGLIQSARGCPYSCNYCVRSFGRKLTYRTPDQIVEEIVFLKKKHGIRSLRFIDDTFTIHSKRVIEICQKIIDLNLDIEWTCLSRPDSLREEMLPWMQKAGCKRIYFGIESGSPKVLEYMNKELDLELSQKNLQLCRQYQIETLGFFILGAPVEEDSDFRMSVDFAIRAELDYVILSTLIAYPGTAFYESVKNDVDFSILPYKNEWKNSKIAAVGKQREKDFYRMFYIRRGYLALSLKRIITQPLEFIGHSSKVLSFMANVRSSSKRENYI